MSISITDSVSFSTIQKIFNEKIPFNKLLGLKVELLEEKFPVVKIEMREELIGHYTRGMLHGGVISSVIDVTGGLFAFLGTLEKFPEQHVTEISPKLSTIDLRIDYLRPGIGKWFIASGDVLRIGNKVAVIRIQFHNDKQQLIAVGTGTYVIS